MARTRSGRSAISPVSSLELARLCGVSQGTVDRALHDRGRISAKTRERILEAARSHGYLPNPAARELMTGRSAFIAAIVPTFGGVFFTDVLEFLHGAFIERGLYLLTAQAGDGQATVKLMREFAGRRMRGIVMVSPHAGIDEGMALCRATPTVAIINPDSSGDMQFAGPDEERTGRNAVGYLVARGHRRIVHLSYERRTWAITGRERGYSEAMRKAGQTPIVITNVNQESVADALTKHRATALFCHNDWLALSAIRWLSARGVRVPGDVSVMGVDNSPTFRGIYPGLTTMQYPVQSVTLAAVSAIMGERAPAVGPCVAVDGSTVATPAAVSPG